jgi:MraZ protein
MFRGRYLHTIDPKGRLSIPAKFRDVLRNGYEGQVIVVPNDSCVEVHPLREWERIESKIDQGSVFGNDMRLVERLFISRAREVDLDGAGRILIPLEVRKAAGLDREVTLVGGGRRYFEVWDRHRFEAFERGNQGELRSLFDKLSGMGI